MQVSGLYPVPYRFDSEDKPRVIADNNSFACMLNVAFNQIRQYQIRQSGEKSPSVMIRLLEAMITINKFTRRSNQKKKVIQHAEMIMKAAERKFDESRDLEDMKERFNILMQKV
jgi:uncharacterized membrane protein